MAPNRLPCKPVYINPRVPLPLLQGLMADVGLQVGCCCWGLLSPSLLLLLPLPPLLPLPLLLLPKGFGAAGGARRPAPLPLGSRPSASPRSENISNVSTHLTLAGHPHHV